MFIVNKADAGNLLSLESAVALNLVKMNGNAPVNHCEIDNNKSVRNKISKLTNEYSEIFEGRVKLKNYKEILHVKPQVVPIYQKMRRHPYQVREAMEKEIKRVEQEGDIKAVQGPQQRASNLVVTPKANSDVRLCLDARLVNTSIEREIYDKTKKYIDTKRKPKPSVFKFSDDVIMKRTRKICKSDSKFHKNIFTVVKVNGSNITVQKSTGERYTRNISFFKKVCIQPADENDEKENTFMNTETFRKTYPKRNRKGVFGNYHLK